MAESRGSLIAKSVQKHAGRAKEKILQNLGKVDRTADEIFDEHLQNFQRQQNAANRLQKEFNNYIRCIRAVQTASKSFLDAVGEIYESQWGGHDLVFIHTQSVDMLYQDFSHKMGDQVLIPLNTYQSQFPEMRKKIDKRGRKLVDYDGQRHNFQALQMSMAKKRDDVKLTRGRELLDEAKRTYEVLNSELHDELPALHDSRILFLVTNLQTLFNAEHAFHSETAKVYNELEAIVDKLATDSQRGSYSIKKTNGSNSLPRKITNDHSLVLHNTSSNSPNSKINTTTSPGSNDSNNSSSNVLLVANNDDNGVNNVTTTSSGGHHGDVSPPSSLSSPPSSPPLTTTTTTNTDSHHHGDDNNDDDDDNENDDSHQQLHNNNNNNNQYYNQPQQQPRDGNLVVVVAPTTTTTTVATTVENNNTTSGDKNTTTTTTSGDSNPPAVAMVAMVAPVKKNSASSKEVVLVVDSNTTEGATSKGGGGGGKLQELYDIPVEASTENLPSGVLYRVKSTYKYNREDVDELSFDIGELIQVVGYDDPEEQEEGWLMGIKESNGEKGMFPANFTKPL